MDTRQENRFLVHMPAGAILRFRKGLSGLYYCDLNNPSSSSTYNPMYDLTFLNTVAQNRKSFGRRENIGADTARILSKKLLHPAHTHMGTILGENLLRNCPVTIADRKRADFINCPSLPALRRRKTRERPTHKRSHIPVNIPRAMYDTYKQVTLYIDFFYINRIPIFHTIFVNLMYRSAHFPASRSEGEITKAYKELKRQYGARGFTIVDIHGDNEFGKVRNALLPAILTLAAAGEHMGPIERSVRAVKESTRAEMSGIPFKRIPKVMIRGLVKLTVHLLNAFPSQNGVSKTLSPRNIIDGLPHLDYNQLLKYEFGQYGELSEDNKITNMQAPRTKGAIA